MRRGVRVLRGNLIPRLIPRAREAEELSRSGVLYLAASILIGRRGGQSSFRPPTRATIGEQHLTGRALRIEDSASVSARHCVPSEKIYSRVARIVDEEGFN